MDLYHPFRRKILHEKKGWLNNSFGSYGHPFRIPYSVFLEKRTPFFLKHLLRLFTTFIVLFLLNILFLTLYSPFLIGTPSTDTPGRLKHKTPGYVRQESPRETLYIPSFMTGFEIIKFWYIAEVSSFEGETLYLRGA